MSSKDDFKRAILEFFNDDPLFGTYLQAGEDSYDPATGENTPQITSTPVQVILLDLTRNSNGLSASFGTPIQKGDKDCYLLPTNLIDEYATPIIPNPAGDKLVVGNITYKVESVREASPGGDVILYNLMLRR